MKIRLYATLRPLVGSSTVEVEAGPGNTVRELLEELIQRWPELKSELFDSNGQLHNNIHVFINGRDVRYLGGLNMEIPEGAEIRIFPPVGGGQPTHSYYGVPDWLMKEYLLGLGGVAEEEWVIVGEGWRAVISKATPNQIGSLRVGGADVDFSGEPGALEALFEKLHWKTLRGGG